MAFQPQPYAGQAVTTSSRALLGQVLGITALGLSLTALGAYLFPSALGVAFIAMIAGFILFMIAAFVQKSEGIALLLFYAGAFAWGIGLGPTISHYATTVGPDVVYNAAIVTGLGMFALAAIVYATGLDLRRFQGIVSLALLGLVLIGIVSMFVHFMHPTTYAWLTLIIFTAYVLIDFARIRAGGDGQTAVGLALNIYLDAINIFLALLRILGSRRSDD